MESLYLPQIQQCPQVYACSSVATTESSTGSLVREMQGFFGSLRRWRDGGGVQLANFHEENEIHGLVGYWDNHMGLYGVILCGCWFGTWLLWLSISYMGCHPSHWWTPSFFKMVKATNQHWMRTISPISDDFQSSTCCFFLSNRQEASHVAHASVTEVVDHAEIWRHGPQRIRKTAKWLINSCPLLSGTIRIYLFWCATGYCDNSPMECQRCSLRGRIT